MNEKNTLFGPEVIDCQRCGAQCRLSGKPGKKAKMLRFAKGPGLCVNCAVHDWLRNTYPINMLLAEHGPKGLEHPQIQEMFANIMLTAGSDANPDEIDWNRIKENWDLPFADKVKPRADNPVNQKQLDEIKAGKYKAINTPPLHSMMDHNHGVITNFEQLNELEPGLGDNFKKCLRAE